MHHPLMGTKLYWQCLLIMKKFDSVVSPLYKQEYLYNIQIYILPIDRLVKLQVYTDCMFVERKYKLQCEQWNWVHNLKTLIKVVFLWSWYEYYAMKWLAFFFVSEWVLYYWRHWWWNHRWNTWVWPIKTIDGNGRLL